MIPTALTDPKPQSEALIPTDDDQALATLTNGYRLYLAKQDDLAAIVAIYNQSIASKTATADLIEVTVAMRQAWFEAHAFNPKRPIYVLKRLIGEIEELIAWGSFSNLYDRPAYHISSEISIYVSREYQGQGIAADFITWMLSQAPALGIHNVVALVFGHNERSLKLFERMGFERWGCMPQVCDMVGFKADVVMLGKALIK
ncbi:MAG: GNAT family N-acetyltransferase [Psychrobacter sp.]|nr:GNAT family N-acetyltransferase [Psychrobacter sp.]